MSASLKLRGRRKQWRISTEGSSTKYNRIYLNQSLKEVVNLTFSDYCSTRIKRKLVQAYKKPQKQKQSIFFQNKKLQSDSGQAWLLVNSVRVDLDKQKTVGLQVQKSIPAKTIGSGTRGTRDWLSKKIMEIQLYEPESKWLEANGRKIDVLKNQSRVVNSSHFRRNLSQLRNNNRNTLQSGQGRRLRSQNNSIFRQRRYRTQSQTSNIEPEKNQPYEKIEGWKIEEG